MGPQKLQHAELIRESSRQIIRELGMLGDAHASLGVTNSQVHALIELDRHQTLSIIELAKLLCLEKSSVSRLAESMKSLGLISSKADSLDARRTLISLSSQGKAKLMQIHKQANERVMRALSKLSGKQRQQVLDGLNLYATALGDSREQGKV